MSFCFSFCGKQLQKASGMRYSEWGAERCGKNSTVQQSIQGAGRSDEVWFCLTSQALCEWCGTGDVFFQLTQKLRGPGLNEGPVSQQSQQ